MRVRPRQFARELKGEIADDKVSTGAAALAFYLFLAIFPAMIFLLSLLPYLPIPNLQQAIMDLLGQALPGEASGMFTGVVTSVTTQRNSGLLSIGALATLWAASSGMAAVMAQLNTSYDVKEGRPFWKTRGLALLLTLLFGVLVIGALAMVILGGVIQGWLAGALGWSRPLLFAFAALRWLIIAAMLLLGFAVIYYFGPDVEQQFKLITPGAVLGVLLLALSSLGFRLYVESFGSYDKTYGSIGAVIVLMLWLYIVGWIILLGAEVNALVEHHSAEGKEKGEKQEPSTPRGAPEPRPA